MVRVVFIDWFRTLSGSRFFEHWSVAGHSRREAFDAVQAWWFDPVNEGFLDDWLLGRRDVEAFLDAMAVHLDLPRDEIAAELRASLDHWTLIEPETKALLAALRARGVRVVLATENVDAGIEWALPALGLDASFDAVLSSHELGARKHEVDASGRNRFFGAYLEREGIGPGESVLIDDSAHLETPMQACGIRFLHAPDGEGPGRHLRRLLAEWDEGSSG